MKLKYYLRGLGIGIICTAIIMGIALSGNKKETLTDTEIIERARLLGMVMPEDTEESSEEEGQEPPDAKASKPQGAEKGEYENKPGEEDSETSTDKGDGIPDSQDEKEPDEAADTGQAGSPSDKPDSGSPINGSSVNNSAQQPSSQGTVQIEIKAGEYSDAVSRKLYQAGLISDAEAFNKYLTQKGADQNLKVGVYEIPSGSTQEEIIAILQK